MSEPSPSPGAPAKTGVLLVNLGTPDAPTAPAVRRYLREFLSDPRVVEIPRPLWWLILNLFVLPFRPRKSAAKYAKIWLKEGSPLAMYTEKQAKLLRGALGAAGHTEIEVAYAMRYGNPAIASALTALKTRGCRRLLILPAFPQYSAATTASISDCVARWTRGTRDLPELRFVRSYHDNVDYISALAGSVNEYWMKNGGRPDKLVMSFHGLPKRNVDKGDPYYDECQTSGRLLAGALGLGKEQYLITFQSRFGAAEWLQPYTQATLEALGKQKTGRVDVICPGFAVDCLETLEEIAIECKAAFLSRGGKEFHYIPCLNERADGIAALRRIAEEHLGNWLQSRRS